MSFFKSIKFSPFIFDRYLPAVHQRSGKHGRKVQYKNRYRYRVRNYHGREAYLRTWMSGGQASSWAASCTSADGIAAVITVRYLRHYLFTLCIAEALQSHSNTQSHWSIGSKFASRLGGSAVSVLGMHPLSQWNQVSPVSAVLLHW